MHEWGLAEAIVETISRLVTESQGKVTEVIVEVGELQNIDLEILKFAVNELLKQRNLSNVRVKYEVVCAIFRCSLCGFCWRLSDVQLSKEELEAIHFVPEVIYSIMRCPRCNSSDFSIVQGRGVMLRSRVEVK